MNFEYLQNVKGLKNIYKYCKNAEDLAMSKPDCSMFSSRKSGEALAQFLYYKAYQDAAEHLTFADILKDYTVKRYINNTAVLDALHNIRKNGNNAVHEINENTADQALKLLEDLHYAVGETARKEHLVDNYPRFNSNIEEKNDSELMEFDPAEVAREMFNENLVQYKAEKLFEEYQNLCSPYEWIPGDSDINEYLEFANKPTAAIIHEIQYYFGFLAMKAIKNQLEDAPERTIQYEGTIIIYGEEKRTTEGISDFMYCLMNELPDAEHFSIISKYYGPQFACQIDDELSVPFHYKMDFEKYDNPSDITYIVYEYLYNHGTGGISAFKNGEWYNYENQFSDEIVDKQYNLEWEGWDLNLYIDFDYEKHADIINSLQQCACNHMPEQEIAYCKEEWEEATWNDGEYFRLCCSLYWSVTTLRTIQNFLDDVNSILKPIMSECTGLTEGNWYIAEMPFAVATWIWTNDGFKVIGTETYEGTNN